MAAARAVAMLTGSIVGIADGRRCGRAPADRSGAAEGCVAAYGFLGNVTRVVISAVVGGPKELADYMEEMFVNHGCDGFVVAATHVPGAYADFVRHVIPEVQRRGLYHTDYTGNTLRENLGLPRPPVGAWKLATKAAVE